MDLKGSTIDLSQKADGDSLTSDEPISEANASHGVEVSNARNTHLSVDKASYNAQEINEIIESYSKAMDAQLEKIRKHVDKKVHLERKKALLETQNIVSEMQTELKAERAKFIKTVIALKEENVALKKHMKELQEALNERGNKFQGQENQQDNEMEHIEVPQDVRRKAVFIEDIGSGIDLIPKESGHSLKSDEYTSGDHSTYPVESLSPEVRDVDEGDLNGQVLHQCSATSKRSDHLPWEHYFMGVACLSAMRSKDPNTQVGSCIVNEDKKIVGIGYNGMPIGCSDDIFPWSKDATDPLETKYLYVCHAEVNAIMNRNSADLRGCTLYTTLFPCNECAKIIIQAGIKKVCYLHKKALSVSMAAAMRMFEAAGVEYVPHNPPTDNISINFKKEPPSQ